MSQKYKIIITTIVALLLGLGIFIFVKKDLWQPNQDQQPVSTTTNTEITETENATTTSSTKTYRNEEWGFEFEYFEDWRFHENTFQNTLSKFNLVGATSEEGDNPNPINPSLLLNVVTKDFAKKAATNRERIGAIVSNIYVSDVLAIKYEYMEQIPKISIDISRGDYNFIISSPKKYEPILNQILSSFRFIK